MIFDCFFSYQHEDLPLVEAVAEKMEEMGLSCWYAPRNVKGRYAKAIAEGISSSKVFVLILNRRSALSEAVLNEIEMAHNVSKTTPFATIQPVCMEEMDMNSPEYGEIMYYIRRMHFVNAKEDFSAQAIAEAIIGLHPDKLEIKKERKQSTYTVQDIEDRRLRLQNGILKSFDDDVYQGVLGATDMPRILDVGCGVGDMLISKIGNRPISAYLGIDRSERQIAQAKEKHEKTGHHFLVCDIEGDGFLQALQQKMEEAGISAFDVINISMVLLHLVNPTALLKALRPLLSENGILIVRDIDDGINFAAPDPHNAFERIYKICENDEQSGNRRTGRQVFVCLSQAGYRDIRLEKQGLSSVGMTREEKEVLFNMYFPFTLDNAKIMMEKYPWNKDYQKDYLWYAEHFEELKERFLKEDFIFSLGFMTYTARK